MPVLCGGDDRFGGRVKEGFPDQEVILQIFLQQKLRRRGEDSSA